MLPVRVTAFTWGDSITPATRLEPMSSARNKGGGKPACRTISSMASAQPVTLAECFSTPPLPAMRAGATKRNTCQNGKFHGITASTAPSGWKATKLFCASVSTVSGARKRSAFSA